MRCFFLNFKGEFLKASTSLPAMAKHHIIKKPYGQLLLFPFELMRHFYLRLTFLLFHLLSCTELDLCFLPTLDISIWWILLVLISCHSLPAFLKKNSEVQIGQLTKNLLNIHQIWNSKNQKLFLFLIYLKQATTKKCN